MSRTDSFPDSARLLRLLQLASPSLPVGAYSYSEGIEYAVHAGIIAGTDSLRDWLEDGLRHGAARMEAAVLARVYDARCDDNFANVHSWDRWLTAARESEELHEQSLDMGRALMRLYYDICPPCTGDKALFRNERCNLATAFALVAAETGLPRAATVTAYLQSWVTNLVGAGVKLIPLGQTEGQRLLWSLQAAIEQSASQALTIPDDELGVSNWGLALASMSHETQYTRLFRS